MKPPKFTTVQSCLDWIPENERTIAQALRQLVTECIPNVREKLSFNVPYYFGHRGICFIWPASVIWGNEPTYEGVRLGFMWGCLLDNRTGFLDEGDRKQVYWKDIKSMAEFHEFYDLLKDFIFEATAVDDQKRLKK